MLFTNIPSLAIRGGIISRELYTPIAIICPTFPFVVSYTQTLFGALYS